MPGESEIVVGGWTGEGSARAVASPPPRRPSPLRNINARYDAAQTTDDNARHWMAADLFSAAYANSPSVRRLLRARSRYECANNSYAQGIIQTLASDRIGAFGPQLQLDSPDQEGNDAVEAAWANWSNAIGLPPKLRTMSLAYDRDGEGNAQLTTNPMIPGRVKLDVKPFESDIMAAPLRRSMTVETQLHDGVEFDSWGNPSRYWLYDRHPGDPLFSSANSTPVPADYVIHWFRVDRPGQTRGIPTIMPAIPLFAELRRYTLAVVGAAESAANIAGILKTTAPGLDPAEVEEWVNLEMQRRGLMTVPEGWDLTQFKAEQPTTTYGDFKREIINEIARCLSMPFNVAAGNSSSYNYSSGRLDHQVYHRMIGITRDEIVRAVLMKIFRAFISEYRLSGGRCPAGEIEDWGVTWIWPGFASLDPTREAQATQIRLATLTTTLEQEWADAGGDFWKALPRMARQHKALLAAGLKSPYGDAAAPAPAPAAPAPSPDPDLEGEETDAGDDVDEEVDSKKARPQLA